jgi:hypothetical protein
MASWASKPRLWVGADLSDATESTVHLDVRAQYLSGGYSSQGVCSSCGSSCSTAWWGCWQDASQPPGAYVRDFASAARGKSELPWFTYYELLQASGASEGSGEVQVANDATFMTRYFDDYRFFLQQLGGAAMVHLEPDFWGYAEQMNSNPHAISAAVASANPTDCGGVENTIAGMGQCMISMVHKYAPGARVGLHASGWATNMDVLSNSDPSLDVIAEANKLATFLAGCGESQADFVALDAADRDAGYYQSVGKDTWWDAANASLPDFHQAFAWEQALTTALNKSAVWWQTPYGNMSLPNQTLAWKDNRLDYFFAHPDELVQANTLALVFGAGASNQTNASSDGGHFVSQANGFSGPALCP